MKMFDIGRGTNFFFGDIVHVATVDPRIAWDQHLFRLVKVPD